MHRIGVVVQRSRNRRTLMGVNDKSNSTRRLQIENDAGKQLGEAEEHTWQYEPKAISTSYTHTYLYTKEE